MFREILGYLVLLALFGGIFGVLVHISNVYTALVVFGAAIAIVSLLALAVYLIDG